MKFLIAVSPQDVISYVSKGWGGYASGQHITENCDIVKQFLPGDQCLADHGFNVEEPFGLYCAQVQTPLFTKGKKQLDKVEVDKAWQLSCV